MCRIQINRRFVYAICLVLIVSGIVFAITQPSQADVSEEATAAPPPVARTTPLQMGISTALHDGEQAQELGYSWIQVFDPPSKRHPVNVLLRVDPKSVYGYDVVWAAAYASFHYGDYIDAYQIGNEPNAGEWGGWRYAVDYVQDVCDAAEQIRSHDPTATIIAGGLAPVGRISTITNGHFGHNGVAQDERIYLDEMLVANVHLCVDAIAYHPQGFSADFDTPPDIDGGTPETDCSNGFCFRGIEKIREVLVARNLGHMPIWATEVGWITEPPAGCLSHSSWQGRAWQIVSAEKQLDNITNAILYADTNYPWLEALFVWNLDFDDAPYYDACEQMRYYSIDTAPRLQNRLYIPTIKRR